MVNSMVNFKTSKFHTDNVICVVCGWFLRLKLQFRVYESTSKQSLFLGLV